MPVPYLPKENRAGSHRQGAQRAVPRAVMTTLKSWGVSADKTFFLGGMDKSRVLAVFRPHIFFDDQISHLKSAGGTIPMVHVPFGVANAAPVVPAKDAPGPDTQ
jgi:hypothetical protein